MVCSNLWGYVVGRPGSKKSPAIQTAHDAIDDLIRRADQAYENAVNDPEYVRQRQAERIQLQGLRREATRQRTLTNPEVLASITRQIAELSVEREGPVRRQYVTNDSTREALGEMLRQNPNGMGMYRDELSGFLAILEDKERHGPDRGFYLEAWSGLERYEVNRINGDRNNVIPNVTVSIFGSIQPDVLRRYLGYAALTNDGFFPRFQLAVYPDSVSPRPGIPPAPSLMARDAVRRLFRRLNDLPLLGLRNDDRYGPYINLDPDALAAFDTWRYDLEVRTNAETTDDFVGSYLSKYNSLALSLGLLFHLAEQPSGVNVSMVSVRAMQMAFRWCDFLEAHLDRILQSRLTATKALTVARRLIPRLQSGALNSGFTVRDVVRKGWSGLAQTEDVTPALSVLADLGWLRQRKSVGGYGSGRPTIVWDVNPKARQIDNDVTPIDGEKES
jgi:putative DNA primase/helicase